MSKSRSTHHRKPQSIGGKDERRNISKVSAKQHQAWHTLFSNLEAWEIVGIINEKFLDPDFKFTVEYRK